MCACRCYLIIELLDRVAHLQQLLMLLIYSIGLPWMHAERASWYKFILISGASEQKLQRHKYSAPWNALIRKILEKTSILPDQNSVGFQIDYIEIAMDIISEYVSFSHFRIKSAVRPSAFIIAEFPKIATEVPQCVGRHMCSRLDRWNCVRIEYWYCRSSELEQIGQHAIFEFTAVIAHRIHLPEEWPHCGCIKNHWSVFVVRQTQGALIMHNLSSVNCNRTARGTRMWLPKIACMSACTTVRSTTEQHQ